MVHPSQERDSIIHTKPDGTRVELLSYRRRPDLDFLYLNPNAKDRIKRKSSPGSLSKKRDLLIKRDGFDCHYCGCKMRRVKAGTVRMDPDHMTIEHIVARTYGGPNTLDNLVLACNKCNGELGDDRIKCRCGICANAISLYGGNL